MKREHIGSDLDDFLKQDGLLAEREAGALKRVVAWQIERKMKQRKTSHAKFASRMKTNRATLDRLFAQNESSVTLQIMEQAALALGRKLAGEGFKRAWPPLIRMSEEVRRKVDALF